MGARVGRRVWDEFAREVWSEECMKWIDWDDCRILL